MDTAVVAANLRMQDGIMAGHNGITIMDESLLEALLGHPAINQNSAVLASLMCSSSRLQLAVHQHCVSQVHAKCSVKSRNYLIEFTRWLARSGHLAKSLLFNGGGAWVRTVKDPIWEAALAGALHRAALGAPHGLQLQSFSGWASSSVVLRALPASHLTHLALASMNAVPHSSVADVVAGLAGLTALQKLFLTCSSSSDSNSNSPRPGAVEAYLPALSALSNMTSLTLTSTKLDWQLLRIPAMPQLLRLRLSVRRPARLQQQREQALQLGHLSGVIELHLNSIAVQEGDELPPQLQKLVCWDVVSTEPVCSLRHLQELQVDSASTPAAQLQQLGQLMRSLSSVVLHYGSAQHAFSSAAGWPAQPLQALRIDVRGSGSYRMQHSMLACISRLRKLTALKLCGCELRQTAEWQLAAVIGQLTGLQTLGLLELQFDADSEEEEEEEEAAAEVGQQQQQQQPAIAAAAVVGPVVPAAAQQAAAGADAGPGQAAAAPPAAPDLLGWPAILRAAARLPQLLQLSCDAPLDAAAVAQLVAATQLQGLCLINPVEEEHWRQDSPSEPLLVDLLCCLTGLRDLNLDDQPHLGDTAMPVIGRFLTQLTRLSIDNCRVTDAGVAYLTGLRQLRELSVMGTPATPAAARAVLPDVQVSAGPF
jgi:hypothetical protein